MTTFVDAGLADRLTGFIAAWQQAGDADTPEARLIRLLAQIRPLLARSADRDAPVVVDPAKLKDFCRQIAPALAENRAAGVSVNPWSVAGLKRNEVRNAATLGALWSPTAFGSTAIAFLDAFFRSIDPGGRRLPMVDELTLGYHVQAEHCPVGDTASRIDLTIATLHHFIGIEIKINAPEGGGQLSRYLAATERAARARDKKHWAVVFLATVPPSDTRAIPATWQDVRAAALSVLPRHDRDFTFADHLLRHFANHVAAF